MTRIRVATTGAAWWNRPTLGVMLSAEFGGGVAFCETMAVGLEVARQTGVPLAVWASKLTDEQAQAAAAAGVPLVRIEDGFVRSVGLGAGLAPAGSFVVDHSGIYYDARRPSDLETLLQGLDIDKAERERAAALRAAIVAARISKYNVGRRDRLPALPALPAGRQRILVVGQVAVDAGVRLTLSQPLDAAASANVNLDLLRFARDSFPGAFIIYKPHPDVAAGLRPGLIEPQLQASLADAVVADADILELIELADRLVTLSSLSGFEALLRGKPVSVLGLPFYAGWGLTDDATPCPRRSRRLDIDSLVAGTLLRYCRYVDPRSFEPCTPEQLIERLRRQRASPLHRWRMRLMQAASWGGRRLGL